MTGWAWVAATGIPLGLFYAWIIWGIRATARRRVLSPVPQLSTYDQAMNEAALAGAAADRLLHPEDAHRGW